MIAAKPQHRALTLAVLAASSVMSEAGAQEAREGKSQRDKEATTLDTMVVTAQKREEALQDVPIMLTALPEQLLQDIGVTDIKDVQMLVPGLHVSSTTNESQTTARIRGVGTNGDNAGLESAVGLVIDGVYRPRVGVGFGDLGEIERIEVLKGPQGTVFGKNTSAGVINVITRRPSYTQSADAELTVGNYGEVGVSGAYNDNLGENAAFRVYAAKRKRDGVIDINTGVGPREEREDSDRNFHTVRGQLLLEPNENLDINFIADYSSREENCCVGVTTVRGATAAILDALAGGAGRAVIPTADPQRRLGYANRGTQQDVKDKGLSMELNWNSPWFGGATLTSITAGRDWKSINALDFDFSGADLLYRRNEFDDSSTAFKSFSQELRLTGSSDRFDWMVGGFYSDEDLERHDQYVIGRHYEAYLSTALVSLFARQLAPLGINVNTANPFLFASQATGRPYGTSFAADSEGAHDTYEQKARSLALFTNNTWRATDQFSVTLGLRYTREEKELESRYTNPNGSLGCLSALGNPAQVVAALAGRGIPVPVAQQLAPTTIGYMCLPWANIRHNGRRTDQDRTESEWSGTLKLAYRWNEQVMTYLSGARGYKGGGFNLDRVQSNTGLSSGTAGIVPVDDTSFPGEFVDSYELGAKTTWLGGNLLLNGTVFYQEYTDFQLNSFLGTSYVVRSIPQVVSKGIDTELLWQTGIDGLMVQAGITYADTRYGKDKPTSEFVAPAGPLYKLPGNRISFAPLWSGSAALSYERDIGANLVGRFNIGAKYLSEHNTGSDLDVEKIQKGYTLVNARVGIGAKNRRWSVELWGENLTDKTYQQVGFDAPLQNFSPTPGDPTNTYNAFLGAPRTYGMTLRVHY
ncbi:TonB-dependent receptor [Luteimonas aquatica]|uniref:TonB-dependent receptor n=1 Tax=Luteimonas aquatica TaxID=450364 RepID=UPI001F56C1CD|nr:TonB-dependent receptor [Luteimonas aquatica]